MEEKQDPETKRGTQHPGVRQIHPPSMRGKPGRPCKVCADLNPNETACAKLRKDLAKRVFKDLKNNNVIDKSQFKQRAAQILNSYSVPEAGQRHSYLQKLVRGIPARLATCKKNKFGRCGK